jgi:LPPG:FO 2-phospho-L-lactate transferase
VIHALTGGVGGAKLVVGLDQVLPATELVVVVNTGDDFDYLGLRIMPDLDSVLYALAGLNDEVRGWGRADESWVCRDAMNALGADSWFNLGDQDLALHILRTHWLREGMRYSEVAAALANRLHLKASIIPMSDDPVATVVLSGDTELPFQEYFVRLRCEPRADGFRFAGSERAQPHPAWMADLKEGRSDGVVICPSNPFVSVDPILSLNGVRAALENIPVIAVSPIVGGKAIKGPAAKMLAEQGLDVSPLGIARHYGGLLDGMVIDRQDEAYAERLRGMGLAVAVTDTMMTSRAVSAAVADTALTLLAECGSKK